MLLSAKHENEIFWSYEKSKLPKNENRGAT